MPNANTHLRWLWGALAVLVADQSTKEAITASLHFHQVVPLLPFFNLTLDHNTGAAFSFLADASGWQRWFFSALAIAISGVLIIWLRRLHTGALLEPLAIVFVLGGAIGNLLDRVRFGYVVDFIQVHWYAWYFPTFNVADSAITIGAALLIIDSLFSHKIHPDQA